MKEDELKKNDRQDGVLAYMMPWSTLPSVSSPCLLTALEYAELFGLGLGLAKEVEHELNAAAIAWEDTIGDSSSYEFQEEDYWPGPESILSKLMNCFECCYLDHIDGQNLRAWAKQSGNILIRDAFMDWYIRWIFNSDYSRSGTEEGSLRSPSSAMTIESPFINVDSPCFPLSE